MADIVVMGSFVMDMIARVDEFVKDGETKIASDFCTACGGKGVNQAVAAGRLGASVEMLGCVGKDVYGRTFKELLQKENIENRFVFETEKFSTGMAHIQINDNCQNRIVVIAGANSCFGLEELDKATTAITRAKIFITQFELNIDVIKEGLKRAREAGVTTILNPAPARFTDADLYKYVDYITPNENELSTLTGMPTDTMEECMLAAKKLHDMGAKTVVATLGQNGSLIVNDEMTLLVPRFEVKAVDSVGAGDSFNGAFAVKLLEQATMKEAILFANAEGALTVTERGAIPSLHTRQAVEAFLKERVG